MKNETREFTAWPEAYDLCRELNRPIMATVTEGGITETCKIYPSGSYKIRATTKGEPMSVTTKRTEQTKEAHEALKRAAAMSPQEAAAALRELEETAQHNSEDCRTFEQKHPHYRNTYAAIGDDGHPVGTGAPEMYADDADAYAYAAALVELGELSEAGEFLGGMETATREDVPTDVFAYLGGVLIHADTRGTWGQLLEVISKNREHAAAFIKEHGLENLIPRRVYSHAGTTHERCISVWCLHRADEGGGK